MPLPKIVIQGNLVADPELRFTPSGKAIAKMRVASSESRKEGGEWKDGPTCFLDMTAFDTVAEQVAEDLSKGSPVLVTGRMQQREWQDNDGNKRQAYEVLVEAIGPVLRAKKGQSQRQQGSDDPWASTAPSGGKADPWAQDDEPPF